MKRIHFGVLAPLCLAAAVTGCKKEEPPPPLPAPPAVTAAPAPLQLKAEDAGIKLPSADAGAKKAVHGGGGHAGGGLGPCCAALMQNAESQPEPNKTYMKQAGQMCQVFLAQGMGKQVVGQLMAMARGVNMPAACR
jgi:hypothetical protein